MAYQKRSIYEFGDDPHRDREVLAEERADQVKAGDRARRCQDLANAVVSALFGDGLVVDEPAARVITFHVVADHLYGHDRAIDVPADLRYPRR
jgi:2-hydroxychromene-2-carboxylate isomerase